MSAPSLAELYQQTSKHSNYQRLPRALQPLLDGTEVAVCSRHEHERLAYILSRVPVEGRHVVDVGGNTGFFSFELLDHGARRVDHHEGNAAHHEFVRIAAQRLGVADRLHAHHGYVDFHPGRLPRADCTLVLNVLHHLGDDFGDPALAMDAAKQQMLGCLAALAHSTGWLVYQMGFNWKGDRRHPLFAGGTKAEMIGFVQQGTAADWDVCAIGVAERDGARIVFRDLDGRNIARDDTLGEFLNRPIFILRSKHATGAAR